MRRSLRWTLIGWYGCLIAAVVAIFGATLHGRVSDAVLASVDASLENRARAIHGAFEWTDEDEWELELSDDYLRGAADGGWFQIADADGRTIRSGGDVPEVAPGSAGLHDASGQRAFVLDGPRGTTIRVGGSIESEHDALDALLAAVLVAGGLLIALAVLGGSWLTQRALRPIDRISQAARDVSERDLSQRVDPSEMPVELLDLARTLNGAFERLEQAFERQARFTADASHELRTPLAVIRAQAETALRRERTPEGYREALSACLRSAQRMAGVVDGLLALARADAGTLELVRGDLAFDELVREAAQEARAQLPSPAVDLRLDLSPATVRGNASLLSEAVSNLVTNAICYNHADGQVEVRLRSERDGVILQVADRGPGIPAEALPRIFERFFRVDHARERERGGAGLGLAITRCIVQAHGGTIEVESLLGAGTTFTVRLPAAEPAACIVTIETATAQRGQPSASLGTLG